MLVLFAGFEFQSFPRKLVVFVNSIMEALWNWLWEDTRLLSKEETSGDGDNQADLQDRLNELAYVPLLSIFIVILRKIYERFIAIPFCEACRLPDGSNRKPPKPNAKLEEFYRKQKHPSQTDMNGLAKQLDASKASIRVWFRRKRNWNRPSLQKKFCETSWRFIFYAFLFSYGMISLWQSPWLWDMQLCWENFGHQIMNWPEYGYYMLESSFYLSLLFTIMNDVKRKDFTEQLIHHAATLFLIIFSYLMTFVRIGTLVMVVHDVSDVILELAKCFYYFKKQWVADTMFVIFALVFIISRLIIYPFWVIHSSAIRSMKVCKIGAVWYFFNGLLLILLCLHIFWASIILKMARRMAVKGQLEKDERSDTEEESDGESDDEKKRS